MNKRATIGIVLGLAIIFGVIILTTALSILNLLALSNAIPVKNFVQQYASSPSTQIISIAEQIMRYVSYLLAGFVAAKYIKDKGWFYGGLIGLISVAILHLFLTGVTFYTILMSDKIFSTSPKYQVQRQQQISNLTNITPRKINGSLIAIGLTALGGYIYDIKLRNSNHKSRSKT